MRAIVTGASGFLGAPLCRRLVAEGAEVAAVYHRHPERIPAGPGLEPVRVDLAAPDEVALLVDRVRPETVFHLASHVTGSRSAQELVPAFQRNLGSTVHLLAALAGRTELRAFVQAGSMEEPPEAEGRVIPSSPYAAAKWAAGGYGRMAHALWGIPFLEARIFMVYGPEQWDVAKLVPYTVLSLLRGEAPTFSSGDRAVDWVYVDDVVEGLFRIAQHPELAGSTIDLGTGKLTSVREVVEALFSRLAPDRTPGFGARDDRPLEHTVAADAERTEKFLGWRPRTSLQDGLDATIEAYRSLA